MRRAAATRPEDPPRHDFAALRIDLDRAAEAEPLLRQAIEGLGRRWGEHDIRTDNARIVQSAR